MKSGITEIFSIVIGVLIALRVSEWNEDRVHTQRAEETIQNLLFNLRLILMKVIFIKFRTKKKQY